MFETKEGMIKPIVYVGIVNSGRLLLVDYKNAPNPAKAGWWIPAPGLKFGEDPRECAEKVASELGIEIKELSLKDVESFVLPGGWHFICHYLIQTESEPGFNPNIKATKWVTPKQLADMKDIAHGKWEINVGMNFLGSCS